MKEIMDEYGSMFLAVTGLILFLGTMSSVMLSQSGVLMKMVQVWMYDDVHGKRIAELSWISLL